MSIKHSVVVDGFGTFEIEEGTKLVLGIEQSGVDISHRCGGNARCVTCQVQMLEGDPEMGDVERDSLEEDGLLGQVRLSCQIRVKGPMRVKVNMIASEKGWDPGVDVEP